MRELTQEQIFAEIEYGKKLEAIQRYKQQLRDTDYKAIKYAEGLLTDEGYSEVRKQRQSWRDEINKLEAELNGNK